MDMFGWRLIHQFLNNLETMMEMKPRLDDTMRVFLYQDAISCWKLLGDGEMSILLGFMIGPCEAKLMCWNFIHRCFYHEIGFQVADLLSGRHASQGSYVSMPSYHPTILLLCHSDTTSNDSEMTLPGDGEPTYSGYNACLNNIEYMLVSYHQIIHANIIYIFYNII